MRNLILILGDQLNADSAALHHFSPEQDAIWMAEVGKECTKVWSTKPRMVMFLTAMRHFRNELRARGYRVYYRELTEDGGQWLGMDGRSKPCMEESLGAVLAESLRTLRPKTITMVHAGEWAVREELRAVTQAAGYELAELEDEHFLCSTTEFAAHCKGRKMLRMEYFYREMRQRYGILMQDGKPCGGEWNYDEENRQSFGKEGPHSLLVAPLQFPPDSLTQEVMAVVEARFPEHPGDLSQFDWPVNAMQAHEALDDFLQHRLPFFGQWQDAMWTAEPWLYHSRLSAAMNLKLLNPRTVISAVEDAWRSGHVPLSGAEGFIRQILGWREYVRGIYWRYMPDYLHQNSLGAEHDLPACYWTGETDMQCMRHSLAQSLTLGYAHHIQRLMVTGLYALLYGARPSQVHEWYLAVYVDAVEWVELPNTLGMSQHADGGLMASKPYIATGKYIQRMSNYCGGCRYDPGESVGERACPFTTLYWDFLIRHEERLKKNPRMAMQVRNLQRLQQDKRTEIQLQAQKHRERSH
jgi:deoxyribodipyrimidine photolyase-related protein